MKEYALNHKGLNLYDLRYIPYLWGIGFSGVLRVEGSGTCALSAPPREPNTPSMREKTLSRNVVRPLYLNEAKALPVGPLYLNMKEKILSSNSVGPLYCKVYCLNQGYWALWACPSPPGPFRDTPQAGNRKLLKAMAQGVPQLPVFELNSVTAQFRHCEVPAGCALRRRDGHTNRGDT